MTLITISDINRANYLVDLTDNETDATRGGFIQAIAALWLGYEIGKEIATLLKR
ncbi:MULTISPECIES: hypothetical protein [Calothrix]|uniref:Uncharacterized protein n=2 Tax=Calothrix TaxID=1186 RepID=A0ABR8AFG0_9CYAN|nr:MULTISPECIES: hypothetical protein [Calothrix]MBD2198643.1 hypothetical protein [Calothrix parietina FACHB-288]MBD2227046.1 hypothetical protein [Calothrix anomala FACHB-343]